MLVKFVNLIDNRFKNCTNQNISFGMAPKSPGKVAGDLASEAEVIKPGSIREAIRKKMAERKPNADDSGPIEIGGRTAQDRGWTED